MEQRLTVQMRDKSRKWRNKGEDVGLELQTDEVVSLD